MKRKSITFIKCTAFAAVIFNGNKYENYDLIKINLIEK